MSTCSIISGLFKDWFGVFSLNSFAWSLDFYIFEERVALLQPFLSNVESIQNKSEKTTKSTSLKHDSFSYPTYTINNLRFHISRPTHWYIPSWQSSWSDRCGRFRCFEYLHLHCFFRSVTKYGLNCSLTQTSVYKLPPPGRSHIIIVIYVSHIPSV